MAAQHEHDLSRRIADLESQLAFQEDTIETLNQLVTQQAGELQHLQRKMQLMAEPSAPPMHGDTIASPTPSSSTSALRIPGIHCFSIQKLQAHNG